MPSSVVIASGSLSSYKIWAIAHEVSVEGLFLVWGHDFVEGGSALLSSLMEPELARHNYFLSIFTHRKGDILPQRRAKRKTEKIISELEQRDDNAPS